MKTFKVILVLFIVFITAIVIKYPHECKKYTCKVYNEVFETKTNKYKIIPLEIDETGLCKITVKVNGIPLKFIIDTGCSTMLISNSDANFLLHHNFVQKTDIGENVNTMMANGMCENNQTITINEVDIDGIKIKDVPCVISNTPNIDLLLGQAVLSKLGKITFDYENKLLYIEY